MRKIVFVVTLSVLALASGCDSIFGLRLPPADNLFGWIGDIF